jgi:hypothetical protein
VTHFKFSLDAIKSPESETIYLIHDEGDPETVKMQAYIPVTAPPPTEVMDAMPAWEFNWWMDWIERRHGAA